MVTRQRNGRHCHGRERVASAAGRLAALRPVDGWALNGFVSMLTDRHMGLWSVGAC